MQTSEPRLMSISKAAGWLGVSRESVARLISEGRLRTVPLARPAITGLCLIACGNLLKEEAPNNEPPSAPNP